MQRRSFLVSTAAAGLKAAPEQPRTFVYKTVPGCDIKADVYPGGKTAAVWIHGGALILGSRRLSRHSRVLRSLIEADFTVISIDYRLAPETKLPEIIEDIRDAFRWLRTDAGSLGIDRGRVVVCGGSAGGYLTLMSGFRVKPRPKALVSYWGYGDIVGSWYSRPDPFYLKQPAVTREEALSAVGKSPLSEPPPKNNRGRFYLHCRQQGTWPKEVAGRDPDTDDAWFNPYCPIRNVTRDYPLPCWCTEQRTPMCPTSSRNRWRNACGGKASSTSWSPCPAAGTESATFHPLSRTTSIARPQSS